jgi:hypothetical protein
MDKPIYLEANQVPAALRGGYTGTKFKAIVTESIIVPSDLGLWSGGSCERMYFVELATGKTVPCVNHAAAPWDAERLVNHGKLQLAPGYAVVKHTMFCGKDMGLTLYTHPDNAPGVLPAPMDSELSDAAKVVLWTAKCYKAAYRREYANLNGVNARAFETAIAELCAAGMVNKAGAITVKGRNAAAALDNGKFRTY